LPTVARAELADMRRRYGVICRWRRDRFRGRLIWHLVGAVWAIDFTEPTDYIDGTDRWILSIRDLASRHQILWMSFIQATAAAVVEILLALFQQHGPPLVLKSDNGSQFIAEVTTQLLSSREVTPLFSPPRRPSYNGGIERPHPILKQYMAAAAAAAGRCGAPTSEDLAKARNNANRFTRPHGPQGPTAQELWQTRPPISTDQRQAFLAKVQDQRQQARASRGYEPAALLSHYQHAAVDRQAVRDVLIEQRLLEIRPKRAKAGRPIPREMPASHAAAVSSQGAAMSCQRAAASHTPETPAETPNGKQSPGCAPALLSPGILESASSVAPASRAAASPTSPARVEPGLFLVLRRLITPVVNWLRAAKIP
jgi:transposase InsO family protein